jgi:peptidoglycan/LPS O-acetylase OafA/YrhL
VQPRYAHTSQDASLSRSAPNSGPSGTATHLVLLDTIRGLAALAVALLHVREINWIGMREFIHQHGADDSLMSLVAYASFPLTWGSIGVPVFFVLSGYVIHRGSRMRLVSRVAAMSFLRRRFIRIYPVFLVSLVITALCDSWSAQYGLHPKHGDISFLNALMNAGALVGIVGSPYGSNTALWSLPIEIQLYCAYPVALMAWRRLGPSRMMLLACAITLAGVSLQLATGILCGLTYFAPWWLGAYVADREFHDECLRFQKPIGLALIAIGCLACSLRYGLASHLVWSLGFAMVLDCIIRQPKSRVVVPLSGLLAACGAFSYSLYAIHMPVAVAFNAATLGGAKATTLYWTIIAMFPVMLAAYFLYVLVERPSAALLAAMRSADRG